MQKDNSALRVQIFGAHPDDCDIRAGGVATLYARAGHQVQMVSLTNGAAGHHEMGGAPLAWRRRQEAAAAGATLGCEYLVLDYPDGGLEPSLDARAEVVRLIRRFRPDLILAPRPWDYHPDHRAAAQLVMDGMFLATVPNVVSDEPHMARMPVGVYVWDGFQRPYPFTPDLVVRIDDALDYKLAALHCHTSQVYEWLPYNAGALDQVPQGEQERLAWLRGWYMARSAHLAEQYRPQLAQRYGVAQAEAVQAVEAFEASEYGAPLTPAAAERLFPF